MCSYNTPENIYENLQKKNYVKKHNEKKQFASLSSDKLGREELAFIWIHHIFQPIGEVLGGVVISQHYPQRHTENMFLICSKNTSLHRSLKERDTISISQLVMKCSNFAALQLDLHLFW